MNHEKSISCRLSGNVWKRRPTPMKCRPEPYTFSQIFGLISSWTSAMLLYGMVETETPMSMQVTMSRVKRSRRTRTRRGVMESINNAQALA